MHLYELYFQYESRNEWFIQELHKRIVDTVTLCSFALFKQELVGLHSHSRKNLASGRLGNEAGLFGSTAAIKRVIKPIIFLLNLCGN